MYDPGGYRPRANKSLEIKNIKKKKAEKGGTQSKKKNLFCSAFEQETSEDCPRCGDQGKGGGS